ncbi:MAG: cytochrome c [Burkholderiales bacterium]|nr:cytochrome c [Burkholderiales bacterium]MDE2394946.1 cytochrome c [Burkholderiales bacterium]MDE2455247.1 cytochrome c [Burkholderiales bacterium]
MNARLAAGISPLLVAAVAAGAWWWIGTESSPDGSTAAVLRPDDRRLTDQGAAIYRRHCAVCHGDSLQGQPNWRVRGPDGMLPAPPHDASGHTWHHTDEVLIRITRDGVAAVAGDPGYRTTMPVYRGVLTDQEIVAALSWIKSQWPPQVRARHDQIGASARR